MYVIHVIWFWDKENIVDAELAYNLSHVGGYNFVVSIVRKNLIQAIYMPPFIFFVRLDGTTGCSMFLLYRTR